MKRFLITGGAGFIGSHLARALCKSGHSVVIVDDLSTGLKSNLSDLDVGLHVGSILDDELLDRAAKGCDGIFHLAALVSVQDSVNQWQLGHAVNLGGTIKAFEAAQSVGGIPVVYASSAAIYGNQSGVECSENHTMPMPISPYGADKLGCEHQARAFAEVHQIASFGLRFFNVFGPGQVANSPYSGVISKFVKNAVEGVPHTVFGDGLQTRDFIYVADIVAGLRAAMSHLDGKSESYVSNLCTGTACSLLDLIDVLDTLRQGSGRDISFAPARDGDVKHSRGCNKTMTQVLGIKPQASLRDGLFDVLAATET